MGQKEEKERDRGRRTEEGETPILSKLVELDMRNEWRIKRERERERERERWGGGQLH